MTGVTSMLGENDDHEIYNQAAALRQAAPRHLGMLAFWEENRDANARSGALVQAHQHPAGAVRVLEDFSQ
ncbi:MULTISPECIES: hypothetical protein [Streptomyces]|uniref:hypothetical protein n=1 Tax=Streptomyces TaxID=1883 RepID=UPI00114D2FD5|nr:MULTISPECIES: hypothetical protein [unclassified Streptomyces]MYT17891.1 hypothetical protein [Streptomyces sp. SID4951]